jgi:hypothetical protein
MKEQLARIREAFEKVSIHSDATASPLCAYPLNEGFKALIELERLAERPEQEPQGAPSCTCGEPGCDSYDGTWPKRSETQGAPKVCFACGAPSGASVACSAECARKVLDASLAELKRREPQGAPTDAQRMGAIFARDWNKAR